MNTDHTCKTCRHWTPPVGKEQKGICTLLYDDGNVPAIRNIEEKFRLAEISGQYGYGAVLYTAECFGCVSHEEGDRT